MAPGGAGTPPRALVCPHDHDSATSGFSDRIPQMVAALRQVRIHPANHGSVPVAHQGGHRHRIDSLLQCMRAPGMPEGVQGVAGDVAAGQRCDLPPSFTDGLTVRSPERFVAPLGLGQPLELRRRQPQLVHLIEAEGQPQPGEAAVQGG